MSLTSRWKTNSFVISWSQTAVCSWQPSHLSADTYTEKREKWVHLHKIPCLSWSVAQHHIRSTCFQLSYSSVRQLTVKCELLQMRVRASSSTETQKKMRETFWTTCTVMWKYSPAVCCIWPLVQQEAAAVYHQRKKKHLQPSVNFQSKSFITTVKLVQKPRAAGQVQWLHSGTVIIPFEN